MENTNNKIKSIFLGQVRRKIYHSGWWKAREPINETSDFVCYKKVHECELERPPLEEKEKIYIPELDLTLQIQSVIKSTDGSITYQTNYTIETIEDDKSKESYDKALKELEHDKKKAMEDKVKEDEKPVKAEYKENYEISRCLESSSSEHYSVIASCNNEGVLTLIETKTNTIIKLNKYAKDNLKTFLIYSEENLNLK